MYTSLESKAVHALWSEPCIAAQVRHVSRVVLGVYDQALRAHGVTVAQLDLVMTLLTGGDAVRPIDLARALHMDRSTVSRNLKRLEERGLVELAPGSSGRESLVTVTDEGRALTERAAADWFAAQRSTARRLGDEGLAAVELLTRLLTIDNEEE